MQPTVPYFRPYNEPLDYLKFKNDYNPNVHVWVFKVTVKANGEIIDEKITNLFNFTLKDMNAVD
jgi:hypothetical protein